MTATTDFIAELVRAANEVQKLNATEKRRLLQRAVVTIRQMRELVGIPGTETSHDAVLDLQEIEVTVEKRRDSDVATALLDAADMIRTLHIVLDTGTRISAKPT